MRSNRGNVRCHHSIDHHLSQYKTCPSINQSLRWLTIIIKTKSANELVTPNDTNSIIQDLGKTRVL